MLVVFVGRLVCSVNLLYMELSYTGSLNWSTRASGHVTVQISLPVSLPGWQVFNCLFFWNGYILFTVHVVFVGTAEVKIKCQFCHRSMVVLRHCRTKCSKVCRTL